MFAQARKYDLVPADEREIEDKQIDQVELTRHIGGLRWSTPMRSKTGYFAFVGLISVISCLLTVAAMAIAVNMKFKGLNVAFNSLQGRCTNPPVRREWRTLLENEKQEYIRAVKCLNRIPSVIAEVGTIWDDFEWVHEKVGQNSHEAGSFLPWHRMFLHIYEGYLKKDCHYTGQMPFWDWGLDWQDLANSSIFNNDNGFGGAGDDSGPEGVSKGHCVTSGPFKDIHLRYYNQTIHPHCLSRTFINHRTNRTGTISNENFDPEKMGFVRRTDDYDEFRLKVEFVGHNSMHWAVRGDFNRYSAANDPLFFLHHTQLDRIWWQWQQDEPDTRFELYGGKAFKNTNNTGGLDDIISSMGLAEQIRVKQVMRTDGDYLCYRY